MHKDPALYILFAIFLLFSLLNFAVIKYDTSPLLYDSAGYSRHSLILYRVLTSNVGENKPLAIFRFLYDGSWRFPPLLMFFSIPFYFLSGATQDAARFSNIIFLAVLIFSTYFIGKRFRDRITGFMASCMVMSFPVIIGHSRIYWLYFPLTCWLTLAICMLLYSDHFKNGLFSVLFGITLGAGALIKQSFPVSVLGPLILIIYYSLREGKRPRAIKNILLACGIAATIALLWYLPNLSLTREYLSNAMADAFYGKGIISFSAERLFFHLGSLKSILLHQFYFYLFILCLPFFLLLKKKRDELILLFWLLGPYVFFALIKTPVLHCYTMPVLPAVALIISYAIGGIPRGYLKKTVYATVIAAGIIQAAYFHIALSGGYSGLSYYLISFEREGLIKPDNHDWQIEKITSLISRGPEDGSAKVAIFPDIPPLSGGISYQSLAEGKDIEVFLPALTPVYEYYDRMEVYKRLISEKEFIARFDYIIIPDRDGPAGFWNTLSDMEKSLFRVLEASLQKNIREFGLLERLELPYGINISVYRKREK